MVKSKKKKQKPESQFLFRQADSIGAADAADDAYLAECFVDTGAYEALRDLDKPQRLIVGRTGSGKTALLSFLEKENPQHVIAIQAESLSLAHLSNSTILKFLREIGVKIDLFFKLLWRHVLTVEILKRRFNVFSESQKRSAWSRITDVFRSAETKKALEYLESWGGEQFWEKTDTRVKELTNKLEKDVTKSLTPGLAIKVGNFQGTWQSSEKLTSEERLEIVTRAQEVVNNVQIRELSNVIALVDTALNEGDDYYYVLVDRLDENWVEDDVRYLLIRALIETSRDFQRVKRCKIVIALRQDLLDRVLDATRDAGFQEEKVRSNVLGVRWTQAQLKELLDKRVNALIKRRYTNISVTCIDVLPARIEKHDPIDYLVERTLKRPRDIINFFNLCIEHSEGKTVITGSAVKNAETKYSTERLRSLSDEWFAEFPDLLEWCDLLRGRNAHFDASAIEEEKVSNILLSIVSSKGPNGLHDDALAFYEARIDAKTFVTRLLLVFYRVGLVGLKLGSSEATQWSSEGGRKIRELEVSSIMRVNVHKIAWRALEIFNPADVAGPL